MSKIELHTNDPCSLQHGHNPLLLESLLYLECLQRTTCPLNPCHNFHRHFLPIIAHKNDRLARLKVPPFLPHLLALYAPSKRLEQFERDFIILLFIGGGEADFQKDGIPTPFTARIEVSVLDDVNEPRRPLYIRNSPSCEDDKFLLRHHFVRRHHVGAHQPSLPPLYTDNISSPAQMTHDSQCCLLATAE